MVDREPSLARPGDVVALAQSGARPSKRQRGELRKAGRKGQRGFEERGTPAPLVGLLPPMVGAIQPGAQAARSQASREGCCVDVVGCTCACLWETLNVPQQTR